MEPAKVRTAWITALKDGRFAQGRDRCLAWGRERCVFGVLCEVCQELGLISLRHYEWQGELPPYSVCMLAGVEFDTVRAREASGRDVDAICRYADHPARTQRDAAIMIGMRFEDRPMLAPAPYDIEYEATPGLGGNGIARVPGYILEIGNV